MYSIFKQCKNLFVKLKRNISITIEFYSLLRKVVKLDILKLSIVHFLSKFINMAVMFLPIKVFLLLSTSSPIESLPFFDSSLERNNFILLLLSLTAVLYLINIILQIYSARVLNKQRAQINLPEYVYGPHTFTKKMILTLYKPCYLTVAAFIMIFISTAVFFFLSLEFALAYIFVFIFYLLFVEYFIFTDNRFKLLTRLNIDQNQSLTILSSLLYLVLFFSIFYIFTVFSLPAHNGILMLLLARLANTSVKDFILNQHKLVNGFPN